MAPRSIDCSGVLLQLGNITVFVTGKRDVNVGVQDEELGELSGQGHGAARGGERGLLKAPAVVSLAFGDALGYDRDGLRVVTEGGIDPNFGNRNALTCKSSLLCIRFANASCLSSGSADDTGYCDTVFQGLIRLMNNDFIFWGKAGCHTRLTKTGNHQDTYNDQKHFSHSAFTTS